MQRWMFTAAAAVLVGAFAFPAPGLARTEKIDICHRTDDGDAPGWRLLSVGAKAAEAHMNHGDGVPGGPVPSLQGNAFGASCVPEPIVSSTLLRCLDGLFDSFDLGVSALNAPRGADLFGSTDGTCTGDLRGSMTVVDGAAVRSEARDACASVLGGLPGSYAPLKLEYLFIDAPTDWWLCA